MCRWGHIDQLQSLHIFVAQKRIIQACCSNVQKSPGNLAKCTPRVRVSTISSPQWLISFNFMYSFIYKPDILSCDLAWPFINSFTDFWHFRFWYTQPWPSLPFPLLQFLAFLQLLFFPWPWKFGLAVFSFRLYWCLGFSFVSCFLWCCFVWCPIFLSELETYALIQQQHYFLLCPAVWEKIWLLCSAICKCYQVMLMVFFSFVVSRWIGSMVLVFSTDAPHYHQR